MKWATNWGMHLEDPCDFYSPYITDLFEKAFQGDYKARIAANIVPPDGYVFMHRIVGDPHLQQTVVSQDRGKAMTVVERKISLTSVPIGNIAIGNRINFKYRAPSDSPPPNIARMSLVDVSGNALVYPPRIPIKSDDFPFVAVELLSVLNPELVIDPATLIAAQAQLRAE